MDTIGHVMRREKAIYDATCRMNRRGITVDTDLTKQLYLAHNTNSIGIMKNVECMLPEGVKIRSSKLKEYINERYNFNFPNLRQETITEFKSKYSLGADLTRILDARVLAMSKSTDKFNKIINCSTDGKIHDTLVYFGASRTGRFSGSLLQPQNMPRGNSDVKSVEMWIDRYRKGNITLEELVENCGGFGSLTRSMIRASKDKSLLIADYSSIESRIQAWLSTDTRAMRIYADVDKGIGHDMYKHTYADVFDVDVESVTKSQRSIGKVLALSLAYGAGTEALCEYFKKANIELDSIVMPNASHEIQEKARFIVSRLNAEYSDANLFKVACLVFKWRSLNLGISRMWFRIHEAIRTLCRGRNTHVRIGHITVFGTECGGVGIRLPSGRVLFYADMVDLWAMCNQQGTRYNGISPISGKPTLVRMTGAKFYNHICQAIARDIICDAIIRLDEAKYKVLFTVHDEIVLEFDPKINKNISQEVNNLMCSMNWYYGGLQLTTEIVESTVYGK